MCFHWPKLYTWACDLCGVHMGYWWIVHYYCTEQPDFTNDDVLPVREIAEPNDTCPTQFPLCGTDWIVQNYEEASVLWPGRPTPARPGPDICEDCQIRFGHDQLELQQRIRRRRAAMRPGYPRRRGSSPSHLRRAQRNSNPGIISLLNQPTQQHHDEFHRIMEEEGQEQAEKYWRGHGWEFE